MEGIAPPTLPPEVELQAKPFGAKKYSPIASGHTDLNGTYAFTEKPGRNIRYRVRSGNEFSKSVPVTVDELLTSKLRSIGGGQMRLTLASRHPSDLKWGSQRAYVFAVQGSSDRLRLVARGRTKQAGGTTKLSVDVPVAKAGRFRFLECFAPPGGRALGPHTNTERCFGMKNVGAFFCTTVKTWDEKLHLFTAKRAACRRAGYRARRDRRSKSRECRGEHPRSRAA